LYILVLWFRNVLPGVVSMKVESMNDEPTWKTSRYLEQMRKKEMKKKKSVGRERENEMSQKPILKK